MDLTEKRRQLEEIRAAREAKQRSVQQQQQQLQRGGSQSSTSFLRSVTSKSLCSSMMDGCGAVDGDALGRVGSTASLLSGGGELKLDELRTRTTRKLPAPPSVRQVTENRLSPVVPGTRENVNKTQTKSVTEAIAGTNGSGASSWKVEMGVGALSFEPTDNTSACASARPVPSTAAMMCIADDPLEDSFDVPRRVLSTFGAAMITAHSLSAETWLGCEGRCVLDVAMLHFNFAEEDPSGSDDSLLSAAAFSEPYSAEIKGGDGWRSESLHRSDEATISASSENVRTSRGLVLLWCVPRGKRDDGASAVVPLCFESEIRSLTCTRHRSNLLFGGAANGSVVVWRIDHALQGCRIAVMSIDPEGPPALSTGGLAKVETSGVVVAAAAMAPSEQSFPSPQAHQSPVLCMAVHGDANYHHLYSVSQEGRVCMWSLQQLRLPSSSRDGLLAGHFLRSIGSCAAFVDKAADAMSKVVIGCLDGHVLEGRTKSSRVVEFRSITTPPASNSAVLSNDLSFGITDTAVQRSRTSMLGCGIPAHDAAIVAVAPHPLHADPRISDTLLTAASDGSCTLWLGSRRIHVDGFSALVNCLRWSPTHPAVFVAGESNGRVAAWDLSQSSYSPVAFVYLHSSPTTGGECGRSTTGTPSRKTSSVVASSNPSPPATTIGTTTTTTTTILAHHSAAVTSLSFSQDGAWLTCGTAAGEIHLLRLRSDLIVERRDTTHRLEEAREDPSTASGGAATSISANYTSSSWIDARFGF